MQNVAMESHIPFATCPMLLLTMQSHLLSPGFDRPLHDVTLERFPMHTVTDYRGAEWHVAKGQLSRLTNLWLVVSEHTDIVCRHSPMSATSSASPDGVRRRANRIIAAAVFVTRL